MKNKLGFSLVTVMIGLTLSSLLSLLVMQSISQLSATLTRCTLLTQADTTALLGLSVLENDLSSLCMPEYIFFKEKENKPHNSSPAQKSEKKEEKKYFKNACVIKQGENVEVISCISMYTISKNHSAPKRIVYTLEKQSGDEKLYTLYRQEQSSLLEAKNGETNHMRLAVMKNIISCKLTLWAQSEIRKKEESRDQKKSSSKREQKMEYKKYEQWDSTKNEADNESDKESEYQLPLLPGFIDIELVLHQGPNKQASYTTSIMTPTGFLELHLSDTEPIQHGKKNQGRQNPQSLLNDLSNNSDLSPSLTDKAHGLANQLYGNENNKG